MSTTLTSNQITIVDLTDTTTYFYYASGVDENGAGISPTINPTETTTHIGLYSGKPISSGQPDPEGDNDNKEKYNEIEGKIVWSEYKGQPGENGKTTVLKKSSTKYYQSEEERTEEWLETNLIDNDWDEAMPDLIAGHFLYMKITETWGFEDDDSSNKDYVRYQFSRSGADANVYEIVTDPEEIIRYTEPKDKTILSEGYKVGFLNDTTEIRIYPYKSKEDNKILVDDIQNFEICLILDEPLKFKNLIDNFEDLFYIDTSNKCWVINIDKIFNNGLENYPNYPEEENEEATLFGKIKGFFSSITSSIIGIRLYKYNDFPDTLVDENFYLDDKAISKKNILIRNNYSEEMAKFYLHANDITMAIQEAGLKFSSSGLTLTNGGLEINNKGEKVFYFDEETGNLSLVGNIYAEDGYFKGELKAASGSFVGDIEANGGTIGGFTIVNDDENNYLISADKEIKLDGLNGEIIADKISLGTGAVITEYIQLGENSFIRNPSKNEESIFIESGEIKIYDSGIMKIGDIAIDGKTSIIKVGESIELDGANETLRSINNNWKITPDKAIFNNITARGSLQAATFEYGKVQTVGGILFVKASSSIKDINGSTVTVECNENGLFNENDLCCFSESLGMTNFNNSNIYKISKISEENKKELTLTSLEGQQTDLIAIETELNASGNSLIGSPFFKLANINNNKIEDNFAIGINSTSNDSFLPTQSISFNELIKYQTDDQTDSYKYKTRMLLGDLKNVDHDGYGLYADNVYLEGRLVSQDKDNNLTAGINSKGQGEMPDGDENYPWYNDGGNIILWGGSSQSSDATDAKFKVDDKGNLYASSGYFEGAIITNSVIEAAEIRTATISGVGEKYSEKYGLVLKDLKNGIRFKGTDSNDNEITYFNLARNSFETKDLNIDFSFTSSGSKLYINENGLNFNNIVQLGNIQIYDSKIGLDAVNNSNNPSKNSFEFKNDGFSVYDSIIKYKEGEGLKTNQTFSFSNRLFFDANNEETYMESYNSNSITKGYDLYITE